VPDAGSISSFRNPDYWIPKEKAVMLERFLIIAAVFIAAVLIPGIFMRPRIGGKINFSLFASHGIKLNGSWPSVIYFWSDYCTPCISQSIILDRLKEKYLDINYISLNAVKEKELASTFNIKTVPSIAIISPSKEMKFFNQGFIAEEKLKKKIEEVY
jgi:thiol-disulfide isomerase/thioredoxin